MEFNTKTLERYYNKLTSEAFWEKVVDATVEIALILIVSLIVVRLGKKFINKLFTLFLRTS